jgi:hypothetical protein
MGEHREKTNVQRRHTLQKEEEAQSTPDIKKT